MTTDREGAYLDRCAYERDELRLLEDDGRSDEEGAEDPPEFTSEQIREYELSHCDNPFCESEPMVLHDWDEWECPCCGRTWMAE